jgi:hypothetical protein
MMHTLYGGCLDIHPGAFLGGLKWQNFVSLQAIEFSLYNTDGLASVALLLLSAPRKPDAEEDDHNILRCAAQQSHVAKSPTQPSRKLILPWFRKCPQFYLSHRAINA